MSVAYTAIAGATIATGYFSKQAGDSASDAIASGSDAAAQATLQATQLQVDELRRQFDYSMAVLMPKIQQEYNAAGVYGDLLGFTASNPQGTGATGGDQRIEGQAPGSPNYVGGTVQAGGPSGTVDGGQFIGGSTTNPAAPPNTDPANWPRSGRASEEQIREAFMTFKGREPTQEEMQYYYGSESHQRANQLWTDIVEPGVREDADSTVSVADREAQWSQDAAAQETPTFGRDNATTNFTRDDEGAFIDPNVTQTRLTDQVEGNLLAPTSLQDDELLNFTRDNPLAGPIEDDLLINRTNDVRLATADVADDPYLAHTRDTAITGDVFEESPGYAWQVEEMQRAGDYVDSAGGNYGGRALIEAERRRQGLAATDYYNWTDLRSGDLAREDSAYEAWLGRTGIDVQRGDVALEGYQGRKDQDVYRGDDAARNYYGRRAGDAARLDNADVYDRTRRDEQYYNYLDNTARAAGYGGNPTGAAASAAVATGAGMANAYGNQGQQLSTNYSNAGVNFANINYQTQENYNEAIQAGTENYLTVRESRL